jgi:SPP1 gp7 family putative phage head morphogenesis protein
MMPPFAATTRSTGKAIRKLDPDGRAMRRMEREFEAAVARALNALRLDLVRGLNDGNVGQLMGRLDDQAVARPFQDAIVRQLQAVAVAGSEFGREQVETYVFGTAKAAEIGAWELANNAAAEWAVSYGYNLVRGLLATTRDWLQVQIAEYVRNSETIGQLVAKIRQGSGFGEGRAHRIAVTEVTRAFAEGNRAAWRASGVIEGREWRTNNDELVCPVCGPLAGKVVGLNETFPGGIQGPPAHVSCRCWIVPVVE